MSNSFNTALQVNEKDNVGTVFKSLEKGQTVKVYKNDGNYESITVLNDISYGHKIALKQIKKNEKIVKYGEVIGIATVDIKKGEHVHIHNLDSVRGRGDLKGEEVGSI